METSGSSLPTVTPHAAPGRWWSVEPDGRILCELCPRACRLKPGDRGFCFVRQNVDGRMVLDTYGRSTGFCIDPIEKKPLNHFLPGTPVLSFGTAGCNLGCKFCQNWDISKSREVARLSARAMPDAIAQAARDAGCRSVAFTYNDPVIWSEYAIDTATACREVGLKSVAVTAGYITPQARGDFFQAMDAANIDLKAFSEDFYLRVTGAHLQAVLETIEYVCRETDCWVELTNLMIPQANDEVDEVRRMCDWLLESVGPDVPIHFTAFHPDFRMRDRPRTPAETLLAAYDVAVAAGLRYVYVGNVHDVQHQSTYCPGCGRLLIERNWYELGRYQLAGDHCQACGYRIAGHFDERPGNWGQRRQPIQIAPPTPVRISSEPAAMTSNRSGPVSSNPPNAGAAIDLPSSDRQHIKQYADALVIAAVKGETPPAKAFLGKLAEIEVAGVYVTLKRGRTLRGCCGMQGPLRTLDELLPDAAYRTACEDPRMPSVSAIELPFLTLTVSLIGPPRLLPGDGDERIKHLEIGKHGLRIRMGEQVGLLLPSVATEQGWDARQFLDAVCRKAGLPAAAWRHRQAVVEIFDGIHFGGPLPLETPDDVDLEPAPLVNTEQTADLQQWLAHNVEALRSGATPLYYAPQLPDGQVAGVVATLQTSDQAEPFHLLRIALRQQLPLQSTLFEIAQQLAHSLADSQRSLPFQLQLAVLADPVLHGFGPIPDLRGVDGARRALFAVAGNRSVLIFDRESRCDEVVTHSLSSLRFDTAATQIYSVRCVTGMNRMTVVNEPRPQKGASVRAPAVAGIFYPAEDEEREILVDQLLQDLPAVDPLRVEAAMVPHAGLRFSGRIAADVWRRVDQPSRVLIIGPKHTHDGVDWAIAPHDRWRLSANASLAADPELAALLAANVEGMELDAAAHAREHGIEVQLPLLWRLAPQTRVTGIAMRGRTVGEVETAAQQLAALLKRLEEPPLMIISSDMNHFADDKENRRRDQMALTELAKNDAASLLRTCDRESISMCGQLPAALVLLTLRALGSSPTYRLIDYGTSADTSGDLSRVVGYAGVVWDAAD